MERPRFRILLPCLLVSVCLSGCEDEPPDSSVSTVLQESKPLAALVFVSGSVELEREGVREQAHLGELYAKDVLETGTDGSAKVLFAQGRSIEVGPNSRFALSEESTGVRLSVERGWLISRTPLEQTLEAKSVSLSVMSPFGLIRIPATQSEVKVGLDSDNAQLEVRVGQVEFLSRSGVATVLKAGQSMRVDEKGAHLEEPLMMLAPILVRVTAAGHAEVKKEGRSQWQRLLQASGLLHAGDALRVKTGSAALSLEGSESRFVALRGTQLTFQGSSRGPSGEESRLRMAFGTLEAHLPPLQKSRMAMADAILETDSGGQLFWKKTRARSDVQILTGDFTISLGDEKKSLAAGQVAHVGKGEVRIEAEARPSLLLPVKPALRVFHSGLAKLAFVWDKPLPAYWVELAAEKDFSSPIVSGIVHQPWISIAPPARGSLYVRVLTADKSAEVAHGNVQFAPERAPKELGELRNEVPEGSEKTTIYYQDKPPAVTFIYKKESGAVRYIFTLFHADDLQEPLIRRVVPEAMVALEPGTLKEGSYLWSVTPLSSSGEELRGGKMNKLELVYDNSVPNLVIRTPRNGDVVSKSTLPVLGVAPIGTKLFINGKLAELDSKNRFSGKVAPLGNPPLVIFRLSKPYAGDTYTVRVLRIKK